MKPISNRTLFDFLNEGILRKKLKSFQDVKCFEYLSSHSELKGIENIICNFLKEFRRRWKESNRYKTKFLQANSSWLDKVLIDKAQVPTSSQVGPSRTPFDNASERTKKRKVSDLVATSPNRLIMQRVTY